jgi:hypothetical protein
MHKSGVSMSNFQIRDGQVIRHAEVQFWDFAEQASVVQEPFQLLPEIPSELRAATTQ